MGQNSDGCISDFRIFGQSLIKENCRNLRTSDDIDILQVTLLDESNKNTPKQFDDEVMIIQIYLKIDSDFVF